MGAMARQSTGGLATKLFGLATGFIYAVAVARLLGPRGYGIVAVAISAATVVATVCLLGANALAVREVAAFSARKDLEGIRRFVAWSVRTVIAVSLIGALVMAAGSLFPGPYGRALLLGCALVPMLAVLHLLRGVIQGAGRVVAAQLPLDAVRWIVTLSLIGILVLVALPITPSTIILVVVVALATALGVSAFIYRECVRRIPNSGRADTHRHENWLIQSLPFLAIALFGIVGTEVGTLLLGWLSGPREAGLYQPIAKLAPLMMLANAAIEAALAPRIVHSWEKHDTAGLQRLVSRSAFASTLATALIAGGIVVASPYILRAFGPEFTRYQSLVIWVAAAQVANAVTGFAPLVLAMTGDMRRRIWAQAVTMVLQAGLSFALIPSLGAVGAVIALSASILTWSLLHWWLVLRATGIDTSLLGLFVRLGRVSI
jgi:O-antigen/teichoic acid export membrane protein